MYLTSLRLKDFAGLAAADLDGFEPGLNVVVGDNEAGKSTLLTALRAAFFQKHRATGEAARALAPYGRQVRPEIEVAFTTGGSAYTLAKGFLQKPDARLAWPGGEMAGDAVEERLAELLGFAHPGRGESKLGEHQGAFGLLWVEQGRSHEHDLDLGVGRNAVTASLEGEIGQILGGDRGRAMLAAAKALQDRFYTASGRVAVTSPLKQVEDMLQALRLDLAAKQGALRDYDEKIERLRLRRDTLASYLRDDAVGAAETAVEQAEARAAAVAAEARDHQEALAELGHATARRQTAFERLASRRALAARRKEADEIAAAASQALGDLRRSAAAERAALERLEAERDLARSALAAAERRDEALAARLERARLEKDIAALKDRLTADDRIAAALAALARAGEGTPIDARILSSLEAAAQARREAEIRVQATAPTILFEPEADQAAYGPDGGVLGRNADVPVLARTRFALDGYGHVTIEPGGDAGALARVFSQASEALEGLLVRAGVASVDDARLRLAAAEERAAEVRRLESQRAALLPDGSAAAKTALAAAEAALRDLPAGADAKDAAPERPEPEDAGAARTARKTAQALLTRAEGALESARGTASAFAARLAKAEASAEHSTYAALRLARELGDAVAVRTTEALDEDLAAAELDRSAKQALADMRRRALDEADPETAARTVQARRRALEEIRRAEAALAAEIAGLEGELRAEGLTSIGEDAGRLSEEIAALEARHLRLVLEAEAARLFHSALLAAQSEAREHWLGPIKAEVAPYLRLIHPESEVAFDESTLAITGLSRRGVDEEFKRLSAGAREQVAVVTRLALATVLKRGGHPALVILDDALVNTDERRLARMHLVLQKAAEAMQIVVLTCRERDFRDIGGKIFRI